MSPTQLFDYYSLRARLQPALTALSPLAFGLIAWTGPSKSWMGSLWTLAGTVGLTFFIAALARNRGKAIEPALWAHWGGAPTLQLLRHRGPANSIVRADWHAALAKLTGRPMPTPEEERLDPKRADEAYEAAARLIVNRARENSKKHPFIFKENVQYGFCRNLYALRGVGIALGVAGLASSVMAGFDFISRGQPSPIPWVCAAICILVLLGWIFWVNAAWVRIPAFAYSQRLFDSLDLPTRNRAIKDPPSTAR